MFTNLAIVWVPHIVVMSGKYKIDVTPDIIFKQYLVRHNFLSYKTSFKHIYNVRPPNDS